MIGLLLRVIRRVSLDEVRHQVAELEGKYGGSLDGLPDRFGGDQEERERFEDYMEWSRMIHALRAYSEGEDFDYFTEEIDARARTLRALFCLLLDSWDP